MLQVKKYANYFHLLTYTNSTLYALTYNYFNYNLTHLTDFNTYFHKKGCRLHSRHPSTLKYYEKTTYFFNLKYKNINNKRKPTIIATRIPHIKPPPLTDLLFFIVVLVLSFTFVLSVAS